MITADKVLQVARKYLGIDQWDSGHKRLIDDYNRIQPRPVGYAVSYDDDWCDAFITVVGDESQASHLIGRECGVQRHIHQFVAKGIWLGRVQPQAGDIITFDWDGGGFGDHIGFVEKVAGNQVTTIEGNTQGRQVARNSYPWNASAIKGYARPKYAPAQPRSLDSIAQEIIAGQGGWGNGTVRQSKLKAAGYDVQAVQTRVNTLLAEQARQIPRQAKVKQTATHWETGQRIADWVKGRVFIVKEMKIADKSQNKPAYLLMNGAQALGWAWNHDLELG